MLSFGGVVPPRLSRVKGDDAWEWALNIGQVKLTNTPLSGPSLCHAGSGACGSPSCEMQPAGSRKLRAPRFGLDYLLGSGGFNEQFRCTTTSQCR